MTRALSQSEAGRPGRRGARQPVNGGRAGLAGPCGLQLHVGRGRDRAVTRCRDKGAARAFPRRRLKEPGPGAAARARPRPSPPPLPRGSGGPDPGAPAGVLGSGVRATARSCRAGAKGASSAWGARPRTPGACSASRAGSRSRLTRPQHADRRHRTAASLGELPRGVTVGRARARPREGRPAGTLPAPGWRRLLRRP